MKNKKNPQRFSIQFDQSIPEHREVIEILLSKGRFASRYIADAILFYENNKCNSLESTIVHVVSKILGIKSILPTNEEQPTLETNSNVIDFNEIAMDLERFKK